MTAIQPLRLGISGAVLALIACAVWFITTDQASEVRQRAFEERDQSLAAARAAHNGVSVEEMKRQADAACRHILVDPGARRDVQPPSSGGLLDLFQHNAEIDSRLSIEECMNNYIYSDDVMYQPTFDLFRQWSSAVLKMILISVGAGAAIALIFKGALSWWGWLSAD
jgi:hypothetical protein